jgi:hypothetical protein
VNSLNKALELLRGGWCKGRSRDELPEGTSYCSSGALYEAHGLPWGQVDPNLVDAKAYQAFHDDMSLLGSVILENYPMVNSSGFYALDETVVNFNDYYAKDFSEIEAMFEKAAIKKDEMV